MLKPFALLATTILLFSACSDSQESELNSLVAKSTYELKDLQGNEYEVVKEGMNFSVESAKDKVILFDIFATWCRPCQAAAPKLADLQKKHEKDVKVIGVLIEEDKTTSYVQRFVDQHGATYTITNGEDNRELSRAIASAVDVGQNFPIPLVVMYYKGRYINHYIGAIPEEMIEQDIERALGK